MKNENLEKKAAIYIKQLPIERIQNTAHNTRNNDLFDAK